jgi:cytoskeletal protein CcmA (bactofilin family)
MSCLDGATLAAFASGALPAAERRDAEGHLVRCRECRERVVALRAAEARLAAEIRGGEPEPAPPAEGRGFALGLALSLGAVALGLAALGRAADGSLGSGIAWLSPLRLSGVYGMAFDFVFWVRDSAPGLLELIVALAATASVAAIAALGVASLARRLGPPLCALLALASAFAAPARAFEMLSDDERIEIAAGERVAGSLAASADEVLVAGDVDGDLFAAGERVVISGEVTGNVFAWARELSVAGRIGGSLHAGSEKLHIDGELRGSLYAAAESLVEGEAGRIDGDVHLYGRRASLAGRIARDLHFAGEDLELRGEVARDVRVFEAERVRLASSARVGRDLEVRLENDTDLELAEGAAIGGERKILPPHHQGGEAFFAPRPWLWTLVRVAAALAFGVALYALFPSWFRARVPTVPSFLRLLGGGLAVLVGVPIALALVAVTLIGLPLALVGAFVFVTALYLAPILAAAELGRTLLRRSAEELPGLASFARILLVGLATLAVASHVPGLGPAVRVVILLVGLGLVAERARAYAATPQRA